MALGFVGGDATGRRHGIGVALGYVLKEGRRRRVADVPLYGTAIDFRNGTSRACGSSWGRPSANAMEPWLMPKYPSGFDGSRSGVPSGAPSGRTSSVSRVGIIRSIASCSACVRAHERATRDDERVAPACTERHRREDDEQCDDVLSTLVSSRSSASKGTRVPRSGLAGSMSNSPSVAKGSSESLVVVGMDWGASASGSRIAMGASGLMPSSFDA